MSPSPSPRVARRAMVLGLAGAGLLTGTGEALAAGPDDRLLRDRRGMPLPRDPKAVPNTAGAVGGREQALAPATPASRAAAGPPNHPSSTFPTVGPGAGPFDTRAVQYLLLAKGFTTSWESTYGASTAAAVTAFQRSAGLPRTGVAGPATLEALAVATGQGANSYRVYAIQTLLRKHGYRFAQGGAPDMSTVYGPVTSLYVRAFQAGHGIAPATFVGYYTWRTLFAVRTSPPMYPLRQAGTGAAQWTNCGPVSAVTLLIHRGITPRSWTWDVTARAGAVRAFRYGAMGLADTPARNARGTEPADFTRAFATYGLSTRSGSIDDTLVAARAGIASISGGDAYRLPWPNHARGPASHWMAVLGWDGSRYLAMDPLATAASTGIQRITEAGLRRYAASNPGHPPSTALRNSILVG